MRYVTLAEIIDLHRRIIETTGGATGLRDLGRLEASVALPKQTFGGQDLYPSLVQKAAALGFSLIQNHPFLDGNKRVGHAALETMLLLNGWEIEADTDNAEKTILAVAAGELSQDGFLAWLEQHVVKVV